jgi:hypothetical protein
LAYGACYLADRDSRQHVLSDPGKYLLHIRQRLVTSHELPCVRMLAKLAVQSKIVDQARIAHGHHILKAVWMSREIGHDIIDVPVVQLTMNTAD